jgi:hypothetical protein
MADLAAIAGSLLSLEVNTIICDGMTAEKMPVAGEALIDIAQWYHLFLCRRLHELDALGAQPIVLPRLVIPGEAAPTPFLDWDVHSGDLRTFAVMRRVARQCQIARRAPELQLALLPEHDAIIDRIVNNSDQLKGIFLGLNQPDVEVDQDEVALAEAKQAQLPSFNRDALVQLRKIWELGTDTVAIQTLIQIDGDVVHRVQLGRESAENEMLHQLHRNAVEVSFQHWSFLVKLVEGFVDSVLGRFFPAS